jgi:HupE / UreJ protein
LKRISAVLLLAASARAHVVSLSTGDLRVDGPTAVYELRIPMYEVAHAPNPATIIDHIRFAGAHRTKVDCRDDNGTYVCVAHYEFAGRMDRLEVECTYFEVTVPNHVHVLQATQGANSDQAVFDQSTTHAELIFRPPSPAEAFARGAFQGIWRAVTSPAVLFLFALALASRSRREALILIAMYFAGEFLMRPVAPKIPWPLSPRFVEAAMALTVVYLAIEILALPEAGKRWIVVLALGLFHGLYFAAFPASYLTGAILMQLILIAALTWITIRWSTPLIRRIAATALLAAGLSWFAARVVSL